MPLRTVNLNFITSALDWND